MSQYDMPDTPPQEPATLAPAEITPLDRALESTVTEYGSSRWAAWRRCNRLHHLQYDVGVQRLFAGDDHAHEDAEGRPVYFAVGSLCHGILRYMQEGAMQGEVWRWEDVLEEASNRGALPEALDEAHRLMSFYWMHWGTENGGWGSEARILSVESHLQTPPDAAVLPHTGRSDTVIDLCGSIVIVDTKTRGRALPKDLEAYRVSLATRPQFLSLAAMYQRAHGLEEPPQVMVNAIVKTKLPACGRVIVPITQDQIDAWWADHRAQAEALWRSNGLMQSVTDAGVEISDRLLARVVPRNLDNCAPEIGSRCVMFDYCHGSEELRKMHYRQAEK